MTALESTPVSCSNCREIRMVQTGYIDLSGKQYGTGVNDGWRLAGGCPACGHEVVLVLGDHAPCPRCQRTMSLAFVGVWD